MMRRFSGACAALLLGAVFVAPLRAGTSAGPITVLDPDPARAGMAGAGLAVPGGGPGSLFVNPAALFGVREAMLSFNSLSLPENILCSASALAVPTPYGTVAGSVQYLDFGAINSYDAFFNKTSIPASYDLAATLGYAIPFRRTVPVLREYGSAGVALKLLHGALGSYSTEATAVDIGGLWLVPGLRGLSVGCAARNIGSRLKFVSRSDPLPVSYDAGLAFQSTALRDLTVAVDYRSRERGSAQVAAGVSVRPVYFITLRAGYCSAGESFMSGPTAGVSLNLPVVSAHYAFVPGDGIFPGMHRIGCDIGLGRILNPLDASDYHLKRHFRDAVDAVLREDFISARQMFSDILSIYPEHTPSQKYLEKITARMESADARRLQKMDRHFIRAERALRQHDLIGASRAYQRILEADPGNKRAVAGMGQVNTLMDEDEAERTRRANQVEIERLWGSGIAFFSRGDLIRAKQEFQGILAIDPAQAEAKRTIVEIDSQLTRIAAGEVNELFMRGVELYKTGAFEEALRYFDAVMIAAPQRSDARDFAELARKGLATRQTEAQAAKLSKSQNAVRAELEAVHERALKLYQKERLEAALDDFVHAEEMASKYEFNDVLKSARTYIAAIKSTLSERHYKKGFSLYGVNRFEAAAIEYRTALKYNPDNTTARAEYDRLSKETGKKFYEQGMTYFSRNELDRARDMFIKALQFDPGKLEAQRALDRIK